MYRTFLGELKPGNMCERNGDVYDLKPIGEFRKRPVRLEDLKTIEKICGTAHFDVGGQNIELYYETSPDTWFVIVDKSDKIVAAVGDNKLSNGMLYGYLKIVLKEYRGRGLARSMVPLPTWPYMGSASTDSIAVGLQAGPCWLEKRHGMYGFVPSRIVNRFKIPILEGVRIVKLRSQLIDALLQYDEKIVLLNREEFVRKWSCPENGGQSEYGGSALALDERTGQCLGYGTVRLFSYYYSIQPLYAESDEIADALMKALLLWYLDEGVHLYMPLMACKRMAIEFSTNLGLQKTSIEMRACRLSMLPYAKSLPMDKVYSLHEYYPV